MNWHDVSSLERNIKSRYSRFFEKFDIDSRTGILRGREALKFATYPFVGSHYGSVKTKILFIGLDLGRDESKEIVQFKPKRMIVENLNDDLKKMNVHIAGTYVSALMLKGEKVENAISYKAAIKLFKEQSTTNPLSEIAFTNLFKVGARGRVHRMGGGDRQHFLSQREEEQLLLDEVKIFNPRVIVCQSLLFKKPTYRGLLTALKDQNPHATIYIAPHPSYHGSRTPYAYWKQFSLASR